MTTSPAREQLRELCQPFGVELHRAAFNQLHFLVREEQKLLDLSHDLGAGSFYLVTVVANDELELEDHCFKLYYLFSHPSEDLFLVIENAAQPEAETYPSIYSYFPAVEPFEREIADLFGLYPSQHGERVTRRTYLHECYPADLYPLRRDCTRQAIAAYFEGNITNEIRPAGPTYKQLPSDGELFLPVGPIHAGVIEPGHFLFRIGGELIEGLEIRLGYTHKGIERLFHTNYTLQDGWRLAECISGDSSFAHSLAYCHAAEALAGASVPAEATLLRGLFLELERIVNHIGDASALAHDVALEMVAAEIAVLREEMMRLNQRLAGHRFLRDLNRPGGLILPHPLNVNDVRDTVTQITNSYLELAQLMIELTGFRDRTIDIGILSRDQAIEIGVTGLVARASGLDRDFRLQHPFGPYTDGRIHELIRHENRNGNSPITAHQTMVGDVFSRFLVRVREVSVSARLIQHFLDNWKASSSDCLFVETMDFSAVPNFEFGLGYVEGWRGDIVYWLMKDKFDRIYRCKVRDPSTLNWPGLKATVEPHQVCERGMIETSVVDFPIINKSFNLSYSGNDL